MWCEPPYIKERCECEGSLTCDEMKDIVDAKIVALDTNGD
jgi:hypothetical protein